MLVGHSYGGTLALAYARAAPARRARARARGRRRRGERSNAFDRGQSRLIQVLSWPVVEPIADATFSQLLRTASASQAEARRSTPGAVDGGHRHRVLALNMRHDDLDAYAGEQLHADGVIADVDRGLARVAGAGGRDPRRRRQVRELKRGRRLAALLPHARLKVVSGGHMAPYLHPAVVAAAARELSR